MFKSKKLAVLAALLSLLMLVMMAVPAFAEEATTAGEEATTVAETESDAETGSETEAGTGNDTEADTKDEETTAGPTDSKKDSGISEQLLRGIINLVVGAVIVLGLVIAAIKFRKKIPGWWKGLKSECGKITWCPKDKLKKNTLVVVIIILAIAAAIGVLDFVFSRDMILLGDAFR